MTSLLKAIKITETDVVSFQKVNVEKTLKDACTGIMRKDPITINSGNTAPM